MKRRVWLQAIVVAAAAAVSMFAAPAAPATTYSVEAEKELEWNGQRLVANYLVSGKARVETPPWVPCGGQPYPGMELRWGMYESSIGPLARAEYHDPSGNFPTIFCPRPPMIWEGATGGGDVKPIPKELSLAFGYQGTHCDRNPDADHISAYRLKLQRGSIPATPGTAAVEEVTFSKQIYEAASPAWLVRSYDSYCLVENSELAVPNEECAAIFDPGLCAKNYLEYREALQSFQVTLLATPSRRCPHAREVRNRTRSQLSRDPSPQLRRFYRKTALPRYIGECR